nr:unnamed protein product [Digitaria exilis]
MEVEAAEAAIKNAAALLPNFPIPKIERFMVDQMVKTDEQSKDTDTEHNRRKEGRKEGRAGGLTSGQRRSEAATARDDDLAATKKAQDQAGFMKKPYSGGEEGFVAESSGHDGLYAVGSKQFLVWAVLC